MYTLKRTHLGIKEDEERSILSLLGGGGLSELQRRH